MELEDVRINCTHPELNVRSLEHEPLWTCEDCQQTVTLDHMKGALTDIIVQDYGADAASNWIRALMTLKNRQASCPEGQQDALEREVLLADGGNASRERGATVSEPLSDEQLASDWNEVDDAINTAEPDPGRRAVVQEARDRIQAELARLRAEYQKINGPRRRLVRVSLRLTQEEVDVIARIALQFGGNLDRDQYSEAIGTLLVTTSAAGRMPWGPETAAVGPR